MQFEDIFLDSIDSTQTFAKTHQKSFNPLAITSITADQQTQGIGRFKRKWLSPTGNLYTTFFFKLPKKSLHLTSIGLVLAISLIEILKEKNIVSFIKWPNDILINNKKVAGILCEVQSDKDDFSLFLGIGININTDESFLKKIDKDATSLKVETKKEHNLKDFLKELQTKFLKHLEIFRLKGFTPFHSAFENSLLNIGKKITFYDGQNEYSGILHSIDAQGALNLYMEDKSIKTFTAGEII